MRLLTTILLFLSSSTLLAQDSYNYLSGRLNVGSIIVHSEELRSIENSYPLGIEVDFGKHKVSQKVWENCNCYPKTGFSVAFWDFDNPDVLGYGFSTMYYVQPIFGASKKLSFSLRAAAGLSVQSNPYDEEDNPDNLSYSTYWGIPLQLGFAAHYRITPNWMIDLNTVFNHLSNGGLEEPNKGINWPTLGLGVSRYFKVPLFQHREIVEWRTDTSDIDRWDLTAFTTYYSPSPKAYVFSFGVEAKYVRRISRLSNLTLGSEYVYDHNQADQSSDGDGSQLGFAFGHEFILGKFLFGQQFAVYAIRSESRKEDVYQRYSLVYRISEHWNAGVALKAHAQVADFADFRVGYNF